MRRSRDELRQLMIDAGCELLRERGLAFDPPSLSYANVFNHIEATRGVKLHRSQVHGRIWESQQRFRVDVVSEAISQLSPGSGEVDELVDDLRPPEPGEGIHFLVEAWVLASSGVTREVADLDLRFDLLVAAQALSASDSATDPEIAAAARANLHRRTAHNKQRYAKVAANLGLVPDPELGLDDADVWSILARTSSPLVEGARILESVGLQLTDPFITTASDGTSQQWHTAALGLLLMMEQLFGIDPDAVDRVAVDRDAVGHED